MIERIREALLAGRVRLSDHAGDELDADGLHILDAESAILTGEIDREEPDTPGEPGPRYTVVGVATDLTTPVGVVCRFNAAGTLVIITCYQIT